MLVFEFKVKAKEHQYQAINEAICIGQFIRNKCLRYWMDASREERINYAAMCKLIPILGEEFPFADKLNSMARQASAERAWFSVSRFYNNCKKKQRRLSKCEKGEAAARSRGCVPEYSGSLKAPSPNHFGENGGSNRREKAKKKVGKLHLKVSRQRKDFATKQARALCQSNDLIVLENLNVKGLTRTKLAKSISDAAWSLFRQQLEYFGKVFNRQVIAVSPNYTSQDCSNCGKRVKKCLSTRTHICECGANLCRDHNAAINILNKGLSTVGQTGINARGQNHLCDRK
jgi:IS605 OrfB family transposase